MIYFSQIRERTPRPSPLSALPLPQPKHPPHRPPPSPLVFYFTLYQYSSSDLLLADTRPRAFFFCDLYLHDYAGRLAAAICLQARFGIQFVGTAGSAPSKAGGASRDGAEL